MIEGDISSHSREGGRLGVLCGAWIQVRWEYLIGSQTGWSGQRTRDSLVKWRGIRTAHPPGTEELMMVRRTRPTPYHQSRRTHCIFLKLALLTQVCFVRTYVPQLSACRNNSSLQASGAGTCVPLCPAQGTPALHYKVIATRQVKGWWWLWLPACVTSLKF